MTTDITLSPVVCAPWCVEGTGHANDVFKADQVCWGKSAYVPLQMEGVESNDEYAARLGAMAIPRPAGDTSPNTVRGLGGCDAVYLHADVPAWDTDICLHLTPLEARSIAAVRVTVADQIEGNPTGPVTV